MDLSKIFGEAAHAHPQPQTGLGAPQRFETTPWVVLPNLRQSLSVHTDSANALRQQLYLLQSALERTMTMYNDVLRERTAAEEQLKSAEQRMQEVQRVVQRYSVVEDPVVASDGFTYERRVIQHYLEDCKEGAVEARSQQTQTVLTETLVANQSLKKLVELLKGVDKPKADRVSTPDLQRAANFDDDDDEEKKRKRGRQQQPAQQSKVQPSANVDAK